MFSRNKLIFSVAMLMICQLAIAGNIAASPKDVVTSQPSNAKADIDAKILLWIRSHENYESPAKIIKQAVEFSKALPTNVDSLMSIRLVLAKADYWGRNNLAGSQELAAAALAELKTNAGTKTPQQSIEYSIVLAEAYRLRQQYAQASEALEHALRDYFPNVLKDRRIVPCDMPVTARVLLEKLGGLYLDEAERTLDLKDKMKWYSLASGCLIRAAAGYCDMKTKNADEVPSTLLTQITACRDALQILGQQLNVPEFLQGRLKESNIGLVRQLIEQRKYLAALKLIERSEPSTVMLCLRLSCLVELDRPGDVLKLARDIARLKGSDSQIQEALLESAKRLEVKNDLEPATELYCLFAQIAPKHPQATNAIVKRADYCRDTERFAEAAVLYEKTATDYAGQTVLAYECYIDGAKCYQLAKEFRKAFECAEKAQSVKLSDDSQKSQAIFLAAQNALQIALQKNTSSHECKDMASLAEKMFSSILNDKQLSPTSQLQILQAAELSAETAGMIDEAILHFNNYMNSKGASVSFCSSMARRIISMAAGKKNSASIQKVVTLCVAKPLPDTISIGIYGIDLLLKLHDAKSVLAVAEMLSSVKKIPEPYLLALAEALQSPVMDGCREESNRLLIKLISPRLPGLEKGKSSALGKLLFMAANAYSDTSDNKKAMELLEKMLVQPRTYRYLDAKLLHGDLLVRQDQFEKARKDYQEIIIMSQDKSMTIRASVKMADTYRHEKDWRKMLATASYCLPLLDQFDLLSQEQKEAMRKCVELICEAYEKLNMPEQMRKTAKLYLKNYPDGPMSERYNKLIESSIIK